MAVVVVSTLAWRQTTEDTDDKSTGVESPLVSHIRLGTEDTIAVPLFGPGLHGRVGFES